MEQVVRLKERFLAHEMDGILGRLYQDPNAQVDRYVRALDAYAQIYDGDEEVFLFSSPSRCQLAGMHTDISHGRILASSIDLDTIAIVNKSEDSIIEIVSQDFDMEQVDTNDTIKRMYEARTLVGIVRGIVEYLKRKGYRVGGFKAYILSDVIVGAGLSALASFEVLIASILSSLYNEGRISAFDLAKAGQFAENVYYRKPGSMKDQLGCALGGLMALDFADVQHPSYRKIEGTLKDLGFCLCLVNTNVNEQALIKDVQRAQEELKGLAVYFGEEALRDVDVCAFYEAIPDLRSEFKDEVLIRAAHFFSEVERIPHMVEALEKRDKGALVSLLAQTSLSAEKSIPSLGLALALCQSVLKGNGLCRIHGEGEDGTIQAYVKNEAIEDFKEKMDHFFGAGSTKVVHVRPFGCVEVTGLDEVL